MAIDGNNMDHTGMMAAPRWSRAFYLGAGGGTILLANHITIWGNPNYIINQGSFIRGLTS